MKKRTYGTTYAVECPVCGETIRDLWDMGNGLYSGAAFDCPHCDNELTAASVDVTVDVVLENKMGDK